jgi:hypothetical protein
MALKPIPEGYHTVTPYLIVKGAAEALEFYKRDDLLSDLFAHFRKRLNEAPANDKLDYQLVALPKAEAAKLGGANTTLPIIKYIYIVERALYSKVNPFK